MDGCERICFVIPSLAIGGTERQLLYLLSGLSKDVELTTVCTRGPGALAAEAERHSKVIALELSGGWDPRVRRRLRQVFESFRPDIVHSFMFGFDYPVNVAARRAGVPVVISSRRQLATWKKQRHVRLQKKANALVDCIVANSRAAAEFASRQEDEPREGYRVVINGIDAEGCARGVDPAEAAQQFDVPSGRAVVTMVANFSPVKDHALFVDMAAALCRDRNDLHFLLVGAGALQSTIEGQIEAVGLRDRFTLRAVRDGMAEVYAASSVLVHCSKVEGCPNAVMEAMVAGVPVVAARVGGIPELIEDRVTGRLVESRLPDDFAGAVRDVLDHDDESALLIRRARDHAREHFGVARMVDEYRVLYAELLERAAARP